MLPRLLLDTHVVLRWLNNAKKLSREQIRVLKTAEWRAEPFALSATSLLEIAMLASEGKLTIPLEKIFQALQGDPFQILPMTFEIASDVAVVGATLRDPSDRAIVATARVHRLRLVTSDQRIFASKLVPVVD